MTRTLFICFRRLPKLLACLSAIVLPVLDAPGDDATAHNSNRRVTAIVSTNVPARAELKAQLPPAPKGVTDLEFKEFFKLPVGSHGLEMTDKLRELNGQRVRLAGYMARHSEPRPGCFLLSALPITLHEHEYGQADELPAATVFVFAPEMKEAPAFAPGIVVVTGVLEVGNRPEADGRISLVRLAVDSGADSIQPPLRPAAPDHEHTHAH